jgi:hypothetical protein
MPNPTVTCTGCGTAGAWLTRWKGEPTCPPCFTRLCENSAAEAAASRDVLSGRGTDSNCNDLSMLFGPTLPKDYQSSLDLWRQQARTDQEQREQHRRERERAEAAYHAARADFLSRGGRL